MLIGARTHDFGNQEELSFGEKLALIKRCGYETIQLAPAKALPEIKDIHSVSPRHIEAIRADLEKAALPVSVLGCYIEPSLSNRQARLRNVETFCQYLRYAKALGTQIVGTETTHFPMPDNQQREAAYRNLKDSVKRMAEVAEKEDVYIGLEPVAEHTMNDPEITRRLLDEVQSQKVRVILDPANLILAEQVDRQEEIIQQAQAFLGEQVVALHVKNFVVKDGEKQMVPLQEGVIDFTTIGAWVKDQKLDLPLLRENSLRASDQADIALMKRLFTET